MRHQFPLGFELFSRDLPRIRFHRRSEDAARFHPKTRRPKRFDCFFALSFSLSSRSAVSDLLQTPLAVLALALFLPSSRFLLSSRHGAFRDEGPLFDCICAAVIPYVAPLPLPLPLFLSLRVAHPSLIRKVGSFDYFLRCGFRCHPEAQRGICFQCP